MTYERGEYLPYFKSCLPPGAHIGSTGAQDIFYWEGTFATWCVTVNWETGKILTSTGRDGRDVWGGDLDELSWYWVRLGQEGGYA